LVDCEFDEYLQRFLRGKVNGYGPWQMHVDSWIDASRDESRKIRVIKFEDLRRDTARTLGQILEFYDVSSDLNGIQRAIESNSVQHMREKEKATPQRASKGGRFIRSGAVEGWRQRLTNAQLQLIQQYAGSALVRLGYLATGPLVDKGDWPFASPLRAQGDR
jgi:hypothetical protein